MPRSLVALIGILLVASGARASELLPTPVDLEPNVHFWTRIYSEVDGGGGLIHDSRHLDVVYQHLRFSRGSSSRSRQRQVERAKDRVRAALRVLGQGRRSGLSQEQAQVLASWPPGVSNATLREAAGRVRFQLGQADKFQAGITRSGRWRAYIEHELGREGVPVELAALPHVESSYNPKAYSRVGAAGLWQFTRSTGRRYLRIDHVVDQRMDPYHATRAAALLLRDNHRRLGSWPLAITAYNHGVGGMARAVRKVGSKDMGLISRKYRSRTFGFASRNFYAEFLAALYVDRHAEQLFGPLPLDPPVEYVVVELEHYYPTASLARALGLGRAVLEEHNPALRPSVWSGAKYAPAGFELRVPRERATRPLELALAEVPAGERFSKQHRDKYYTVRRGDTLSSIAQRNDVRISEIVSLNNLRSRHRIRVGQVLILPDDARGGGVVVARADPPANGLYRVRRGDSLWVIARRFGVSEAQLARENGLRNRNVLQVGQTLRLPGTASAAPEPEPEPAVVIAAEPEPAAPELPEAKPEPAVVAASAGVATDAAPARESAPGVAPASEPETAPSNYAVRDGRIVVQAEETLGHYADWLEVSASDLRRRNGRRYGTPVVIGERLRLDLRKVTPETFLERRLAYHQAIQEEFFASYIVTGTRRHALRRGDTLWELANREFRVPVWLLRQYNPDLDFGSLPVGAQMVVPEVEPREPAG